MNKTLANHYRHKPANYGKPNAIDQPYQMIGRVSYTNRQHPFGLQTDEQSYKSAGFRQKPTFPYKGRNAPSLTAG
jgi:hypothetical protein